MISERCQKENHELQRIKYLCVEKNCKENEKLGCADCFLESHIQHKKISTSVFLEIVQKKVEEMKIIEKQAEGIEESELVENIENDFQCCQNKIIIKFDQLKTNFKQMISKDIKKISQDRNTINQEFQEQIEDFKSIASQNIFDLDGSQVQKLIDFNQRSGDLVRNYHQKLEQLQQSHQKIKSKKQKYLSKISAIVQTILKEFKTNMNDNLKIEDSIQESQQEEDDLVLIVDETPRKKVKRGNLISASAVTQRSDSPSKNQIFDMIRQKRRSNVQQEAKGKSRK